MPALTTYLYSRSQAIYAFQSMRMQAWMEKLRSKILGLESCLEDFSDVKHKVHPTSTYLGVRDIQINQIVGSVGRKNDFDRKFRPLRDNLCDRWVNIYMHIPSDDLPAIHVYMVGDKYYVEDGHHRVSASRFMGREFIQAEIWEYTQQFIPCCLPCHSAQKVASRSVSY